MIDIKKRVSQNIKDVRNEKGLTQKELSEKMSLRASVIGNYESGRQNLTIETLQKVADTLGVDIVRLMQ